MGERELAVEVVGLTKRYGAGGPAPVDALAGVELRIFAGEIFALLGPNGAGKTTLIGCVAGLIVPTSGSARVLGHDVRAEYRLTRRAVGLVPQEVNFDPFFTVEESLRFQAGYFGVRLTEARLTELLAALSLTQKRSARTRQLSGGMKRRLLIAKALVHDPQVLFLDEPTAGVDVELRRDLWRYVQALRARGTTIVLTTHYLEEAEELADRIGLIDRGRLLLVDDKEAVLQRFGERSLRITLGARVEALPAPLLVRGALLSGDGLSLLLTQAGDVDLGPVLQEALAGGLQIRDIETRRTDLEDVYVKLLAGGRAGAPP